MTGKILDITRLSGYSSQLVGPMFELVLGVDMWIEENHHCPNTVYLTKVFLNRLSEQIGYVPNTITTLVGTLEVKESLYD